MFKKIMVMVAAAGLLLGCMQAKSLRDVLGDKLDQKHTDTITIDLTEAQITEITPDEGQLLAKNYPNLKEIRLDGNRL